MRRRVLALCAVLHGALLLLISYTIGALLGVASGYVITGKVIGISIAALALIAYYRQPEPSRRRKYYALKWSILNGDTILSWGYLSASSMVLVGWKLVIALALIAWVMTWLLS